jgi:hypothetical protein
MDVGAAIGGQLRAVAERAFATEAYCGKQVK